MVKVVALRNLLYYFLQYNFCKSTYGVGCMKVILWSEGPKSPTNSKDSFAPH